MDLKMLFIQGKDQRKAFQAEGRRQPSQEKTALKKAILDWFKMAE